MKHLIILCLLVSAAFAQNTTVDGIQKDFDNTFNSYSSAALKFVDKIGSILEKRVNDYVAVHQTLIDQLNGIAQFPNINLDANSQKILSEGVALLNSLIEGYRKSLTKEIFINELDKYMTILKTDYLAKAQQLINLLISEVAKNSAVGKCWNESRSDLESIVKSGFLAARDAAGVSVFNANITLNTNEFLVKSTVETNKAFISSCQQPGVNLTQCASSFLNLLKVSFAESVKMWASSTQNAIKSNMQLAEILINSATTNAVNGIVPVVSTIERCVRNILISGL